MSNKRVVCPEQVRPVLRAERVERALESLRRTKRPIRKGQAFLFARGRSLDFAQDRQPNPAHAASPAGSGIELSRLCRACRGTHGRLFALPSSMSNIKKYFVYILKCSDNSLYVGHTSNIKNRLLWHRSGFASQHTSIRLPVELVYTESHSDEISARNREHQIKRWSGKKKHALITGDFESLRKLSKSRE